MQNLGQKVIYQIYPKSFYDANGDGIGDLRGIIEKIDYIKKLNVDMIWFNPFYVSPQNDNGYDIANYREIDPLFGTMADFEELQAKLADIGVGVMLDMVLNHCSTEHEWFKKALAGDEKYRKFFYLRPGKPDGSLPNNWQSKFGGPAWSKFGDTDLYYLHLYDSTQADLDWHNPEVRKELEDVVNFWRGKGVRGFRFDVINVTGKSEDLVDSTDPTEEKTLYTDTPVVHDYLKELNRTTFGQDEDSITVGEMSSTTIPNSVRYTNPKEKELSMVFTFHHLKVDYKDGEKWTKTPFDFMKLKGLLSSWQTGMTEGGGWNAVFWNNHDQPWALNRFGDPVHYREKSAEMLVATIYFLRGTPFIYQGEELGMVNPDYQSMDEYVDVECKNAYQELLDKGMSEDEAFAIIKAKSRDNSRVPMHWDDSKYAGFSQVKPWLLPTHQDEINVKKELAEGEIFAFYQKLIALRKQEAVISAGGFREILPDDQQVFAYVRELDGEKLVVFNNFYGKEAVISVPSDLQECGQILLDNYKRELICLPGELSLRPYESLAFRI
ncbi:alpha,alpha-phosphotrehalase [Lactobacillus delbrueckii subsp. lactis DSM 20072]|uniref:alpha,alpha-phosphotrehalase n=1 Tax=Lactobacillus delbrueckii TaxID=1584 RepID=UPI000202FD3C|nr:alpha,alpha-phosphotrehalase [Lactobacillus delbrueckii]ASW11189.1 alpha,alpha-phosphotrehalase [Lactobacillus delbrueckii subsp. lactis DSM 20072]EGD27463.1 alpha,alpha-phosphotrehalase [Lactobacillus delbrueckii subsp. lactis DSM 20072]KRK66322.1 alpha,alpha-phosphotrehalase [Lactobacillus delbrueckii subsp. lactis DSM 20072]MCT3500863.1 alpha,alpha-phosphotrehalase [Lactobacillus delbrueckii subsp. lactis]OOV10490.1 alpha,alpha-phosphotrehalase [Lactobacillus delbrueckii subsp. lactis DS